MAQTASSRPKSLENVALEPDVFLIRAVGVTLGKQKNGKKRENQKTRKPRKPRIPRKPRKTKGRPEPAGAGQKAETGENVRCGKTRQRREAELGAGNQDLRKGPWPSPVEIATMRQT